MLKDEKKVTLVEGQEYTLTTRQVVGDENIGHINYAGLPEDVAAGNKILIDDGLIELLVTSVEGTDIHCTVVNGGELGQRKGVNVPKVKVKLPALTEKDMISTALKTVRSCSIITVTTMKAVFC